ncbi:hypothetical protein [Halomarina ordinaria]|uniref:DUF58 domain-containing protein n=1 Tax=Halomarina ordinaria TaxID=3033939 RepID=A0ABD5UCA1_9EURY|nr:hypothetical protein [Halomarina sp. PSRA2]
MSRQHSATAQPYDPRTRADGRALLVASALAGVVPLALAALAAPLVVALLATALAGALLARAAARRLVAGGSHRVALPGSDLTVEVTVASTDR